MTHLAINDFMYKLKQVGTHGRFTDEEMYGTIKPIFYFKSH